MLKKIKLILYINYFLIFQKKNWFRNYLLNKEKFTYLKNGSIHGDTYNVLDNLFNLSKSRLQRARKNTPFNNQTTRTKALSQVINIFQPDEIFETGTLLGNTTEFFGKFETKVTSVEISELYYTVSKIRFFHKENVKIVHGDSSKILSDFLPNEKKILFYLDAHSHSREVIPLEKEIKHCLRFKNSLILIDDFKVPNNIGFGFDSYHDVDLSIDNYPILKKYDLYFPNYDPKIDENNRGYVLVDPGGFLKNKLKEIFYLSIYEELN